MFDRPTALIIGAGAGFDIEMPMGDRLAGLIAEAVDFNIRSGDVLKGDARIAQALQNQASGDWGQYVDAGKMIAQGIRYSRSIDNYVHAHSDKEAVKVLAKIAIVQTILDAEKGSDISIERKVHPPTFKNEPKAYGSWLTELFTVLRDGVIEAKNLDKIFDNLTIINFNYDRCIEHYLFHLMQRLYPSKGEGYVTELINAKLKVVHPYGVVGKLPWQSKVDAVRFGGEENGNDLGKLSEHIRTYNEEVDDKEKINEIRKAIEEARRMVFLGFHFHKQNVELLSPDKDQPDYSGGAVVVYATQVNRAPADVEIIETIRLPSILHGKKTLPSSSFKTERGCKELFRDFGGVLSG
jgi:hypothetical protein